MVVEVKARGRRHSLAYVEDAQHRDRPPGPFRTYNFEVDRVLVWPGGTEGYQQFTSTFADSMRSDLRC